MILDTEKMSTEAYQLYVAMQNGNVTRRMIQSVLEELEHSRNEWDKAEASFQESQKELNEKDEEIRLLTKKVEKLEEQMQAARDALEESGDDN